MDTRANNRSSYRVSLFGITQAKPTCHYPKHSEVIKGGVVDHAHLEPAVMCSALPLARLYSANIGSSLFAFRPIVRPRFVSMTVICPPKFRCCSCLACNVLVDSEIVILETALLFQSNNGL